MLLWANQFICISFCLKLHRCGAAALYVLCSFSARKLEAVWKWEIVFRLFVPPLAPVFQVGNVIALVRPSVRPSAVSLASEIVPSALPL